MNSVHRDSGMPDSTFLMLPMTGQFMDPKGIMPDMTMPLAFMVPKEGATSLVTNLSRFLAHEPPPPDVQIPGRN